MTGSRAVSFHLGELESGEEDLPLRSKASAFFNESPVVGPPMSTIQKPSKNDASGSQTVGAMSSMMLSSPSSSNVSEAWRKFGKLYRAKVIMEDEENGGNTFVLSGNCRIERYYSVAEKVLRQFLSTRLDANGTSMSNSLREAYLVGNRLVKFLSTVLPTHPDYFKTDPPEFVTLRSKSQAQLVQLLQYLEQIALLIDEDQYNKYILQDLHNRMASSASLQDTTLSSIELASTSDTSFSSLPFDSSFNQPPPFPSSDEHASAFQRPPRSVPDNVHHTPEPQVLPKKRNKAGKGVNASPVAGFHESDDGDGQQKDAFWHVQEIETRMQQQYQSTTRDTTFSEFDGHQPQQTTGDSNLFATETKRISKSNGQSKAAVLENWTPQFPPLEDFQETIENVGDNYGQQASTATCATTSSSTSSATSSINAAPSMIEKRWIQAKRDALRLSREDENDSIKKHPRTVKELRPWQSTSASSDHYHHHSLLQPKSKTCWPTPPKKNVSYLAARDGTSKDDDEEVELELEDEEAYLAVRSRPGEDEASLTSSATMSNSNNNHKPRRAGVLKQFKGCVNCLVN